MSQECLGMNSHEATEWSCQDLRCQHFKILRREGGREKTLLKDGKEKEKSTEEIDNSRCRISALLMLLLSSGPNFCC